MGHKRYSGNHPRFSKRADERYDAKEAYNKDLSDSARLHYLENVRHDHDSPASMKDMTGKTNQKMIRQAEKEKNISKSMTALGVGENFISSEDFLNQMQAFKEDQRNMKLNQDKEFPTTPKPPKGSPFDRHTDKHMKREAKRIARRTEGDEQDIYYEMLKKSKEPKRGEAGFQQDPQEAYYENRGVTIGTIEGITGKSPFNACAIDEGGSGCIKKIGGSWRVISNKTDKPWPAKYGSESKAKAALRGYHAG